MVISWSRIIWQRQQLLHLGWYHYRVQCIAEFVKNRPPVVQYRDFLKIKTGQPEADEPSNNNMCILCMNSMEGSQAVREPCNCSHAFHRECLDVWIDEGQLTCPLCRSELVPNSTPKTKDHKEMGDFEEDDPWRSEIMVYLFGEDHPMSYSIGRLDNPSLISFWMTKT
ncbi:hypothetical protein CerSpe_098790 [Prunus speciosa]